ncbi:MAG: adenylate/guanylate cyclase domain-containing protein [Hyphomicrobium sp.]
MHVLWRGDTLQRLRLVSGLILFAFAATHFLNHALGLISVDAMLAAQQWRWTVTRSIPGTIVLATALVLHVSLALYKLAMRSTLYMPRWELVQLVGGLAIPILLFPHIVNTRVARMMYGVDDTYVYELLKLWPESAVTQSLLLVFVWAHGCIGIHFWLRLYAPYRRLQPILLAVAIFVPLAALGGFMVGGRGIAAVAENPDILTSFKRMTNWPSATDADHLAWIRTLVRGEYLAVVAVVLVYFTWGRLERRWGPKVAITYLGGPTLAVPQGPSLLEISRMNRVPHASICGGRARCSTCRVRIERSSVDLPQPEFPEIVTLAGIKAPPNVRLACQIRPRGKLTVTRLLQPGLATYHAGEQEEADAGGVERALAVMFVDLRDFTRLAEQRMPFDIVFILNEFFSVVGSAITGEGGRIDKFLGDGLLAVFGERSDLETGCRQALRTARGIDLALDRVNAQLQDEIGRKLAVGIGIDAGTLVLGRIGFGENVDVTVIGTPVNIANRLEALSKEKGLQIVFSRAVARHAGWEPVGDFSDRVTVRGVAEPIEVIGLARGRDLPEKLFAAAGDQAGEGTTERAIQPTP